MDIFIKKNQRQNYWLDDISSNNKIQIESGGVLNIYYKSKKIEQNNCDINIFQGPNSKFKLVAIYTKSQTQNLKIQIQGNNTETKIYNIINLNKNTELSLNQNIVTGFEDNQVIHKTQSILKDNSRASITHSAKALSTTKNLTLSQNIANISLDSKTKIIMRPILQIQSESVKCKHAATSGYLDQNTIYYLQCRGISLSKTKSTLLSSWQQEILKNWQQKAKIL